MASLITIHVSESVSTVELLVGTQSFETISSSTYNLYIKDSQGTSMVGLYDLLPSVNTVLLYGGGINIKNAYGPESGSTSFVKDASDILGDYFYVAAENTNDIIVGSSSYDSGLSYKILVNTSSISINNTEFTTVAAETPINIEVVDYNNLPIGSPSASVWLIPSQSDTYISTILATGSQTQITFQVYFKDSGSRTVVSQSLIGGSIDTGGVVINAASGINTFLGSTLAHTDIVSVTYTPTSNYMTIELEF